MVRDARDWLMIEALMKTGNHWEVEEKQYRIF